MYTKGFAYAIGPITRLDVDYFIIHDEATGNKFKIFFDPPNHPAKWPHMAGVKYIKDEEGNKVVHSWIDIGMQRAITRKRNRLTKFLLDRRGAKII